jgi:hypothetical protein
MPAASVVFPAAAAAALAVEAASNKGAAKGWIFMDTDVCTVLLLRVVLYFSLSSIISALQDCNPTGWTLKQFQKQ